ICPGGIGYDINCIHPKTYVMSTLGYTRPIGAMAGQWRGTPLACFGLRDGQRTSTAALRWFGQRPRAEVLCASTAFGDRVRATADHPFWTPRGMVPLGELKPGDRVALAPFRGVPYRAPSEAIVVSEADFAAKWAELQKGGGNGLGQALAFLKARGLLPLRYSSPALPYLCKILGFVFGDGGLHFVGGRGKGVVSFYGEARDLEDIRADVERLGITPSRVYTRHRSHTIQTEYAEYRFERVEEWFKVGGSGFAVLLACLGAPVGNRARQDYAAP